MIRSACLAALLLLAADALAAPAPLSTVSEQSGFKKTGRYDEVVALCAAFAKAYPDAVRCNEFGKSPEGRAMFALTVTRSGALTSDVAHQRKLPVVLIQGGIHAGEIDGKDAGFLALRDLLQDKAAKGALEKMVLVFVPVFNVDGHERFGRWNRPNQRGPEEMGWRTTAQNLNLNRDYLKADAPEMQAMLRLIGLWDPIVYVDLHVTDGAQFQHDVSVTIEPVHAGDADMRGAGLALRDAMMARLTQQGSLPLPFYPSFVGTDDPASGFEDGVPTPRFSHGYALLRNRFGVLVETHSWKDYATRVKITRNTIVDLVELTVARGERWLELAAQADAHAAGLGGTQVPLDYKVSDKVRTIDFRGYAYTRTPSAISGGLLTRYDEKKPQIWKVPLKDDVQPATQIDAPKGGYVIPAAQAAWLAERMTLHGIEFRALAVPTPKAAAETFRASKISFASAPSESHTRATLEGSWKSETVDLSAGALFVPIAQARSRLVVAMFEPTSADSLASWGFFNAAFERKEYMEAYVAEDVAREMLKKDPALASEFNNRIASDAEFAKSQEARLDFFIRRHASWDDRLNLYPILRVQTVPR